MDRRAKAAALEMLADTSAVAPQERLWGITELCAEFALSPRAIRFYEDKGLLAPRRINGARVYGQRERARLKIIQRAKAIGSSLDEIKHFLDLYGAHGEGWSAPAPRSPSWRRSAAISTPPWPSCA
jgi:hypothetical protein